MRLLKTMSGGYLNCDSIRFIRPRIKYDNYMETETIKTIEVETDKGFIVVGIYKDSKYTAEEKRDIALAELVRRLTNDHENIEVLTDEQAEEELKRRGK